MGKVYSQDFRLCALAAIDKGQSKLSVHRTLGVSRSTIDDWLLIREQTGAVLPKATPPSPRRSISDLAAFETFALAHQETTLAQMAVAWQEETATNSASTPSHSLCGASVGREKKELSLPRTR